MLLDVLSSLNTSHLWILIFAALLTGMSKAGVYGLGMIVAPVLASEFGGKASAGLLLPMLSMADIIAVFWYSRHASWPHLRKLFPFAAAGVLIAIWVGEVIDDKMFKSIMAFFILGCIPVMIWRETTKNPQPIKGNWLMGGLFGVTGGFSTMIGNAAGPIMSLYLLVMQLPKNVLIGTGAWFFLVINLFKIPFHVIVWKTITVETFSINLLMFPVIVLGGVIGILVARVIPEKPFRWFVIGMTVLASVRLVIMS
jgi:uncharacterized protein